MQLIFTKYRKMRVLLFTVSLTFPITYELKVKFSFQKTVVCLIGIARSLPIAEEVQPIAAPVVQVAAEDVYAAEDESVDALGRTKRTLLGGLLGLG